MMQKFALLFPGQGSQSVGLLAELARAFPLIRQTFKEASEVLHYDVWDIAQTGPASRLDQTEITQPVVLTADIAVYRLWVTLMDQVPSMMAGHSLGEYAALVASGALTLSDALLLVANRGRYMQAAVPAGVGAMAALVGLDDVQVQTVCDEAAEGDVLAPANFNSIGQVVIAGHTAAVRRAIDCAKARGAKIAKLIPVSVPSHSLLMQPAAQQLAGDLADIVIRSPLISVVQNADVKVHFDPECIRDDLIRQLVSPVRWVQTIQKMQEDRVNVYVECGPGTVLCGLVKRILSKATVTHTDTPKALAQSIQTVKEGSRS